MDKKYLFVGYSTVEIPFYHKDNPNDYNCAPVCLRMAFAYFGINKSIDEIYSLTDSLGTSHVSSPWGMCIGTSSVGLKATFISENPYDLNEEGYHFLHERIGFSSDSISKKVCSQVQKCESSENIDLLLWNDKYLTLPEEVVSNELGIVISTVWWGREPHAIVITNYDKDIVFYHDPNLKNGSNRKMDIDEFRHRWLHKNSDNDLLIISRETLNLNSI